MNTHAAYPMVIDLPDRTQARVRITHIVVTSDRGDEELTQLVSVPPVYELLDGTVIDLDVTIPDDLAAAGWFWFGSLLAKGDPQGAHVGVHTSCYPPPGWPAPQGTCFDSARRFEAAGAAHHERRVAERVAIAAKTKRPRRDAPTPVAIQTMMEI